MTKLYKYVSVLYMDEPMSGKEYNYKTNISDIEEGDIILVDRNGYEVEAEVTDVRTYKENEVPFPLDKTKDVIKVIEHNGEIIDYDDEDNNIWYDKGDIIITKEGRIGKVILDERPFSLLSVIFDDDIYKSEMDVSYYDIVCRINNTFTCPICDRKMIPVYKGFVDKKIKSLEKKKKIIIMFDAYDSDKLLGCSDLRVKNVYYCSKCDKFIPYSKRKFNDK